MLISRILLNCFLVLLSLNFCESFHFNVGAKKEECFFEEVQQHQNIGVMFHVTKGGFLDIDFKATAPDGREIYQGSRESEGKYTFSAQMAGTYSFCFSNRMSSLTPKVVAFEISLGDQPVQQQQQDDDFAKEEHVSALANEISKLTAGLSGIQSEQKYMKQREETHRNTNESTNNRVLWWSIWEVVLIIGMSGFQVYYLRRFFEIKRVV